MTEKIHELAEDHFLFQLITGPTQRSGNTLDLCFSNNPGLLYHYETVPTIHSDHRIIECSTKFSTTTNPADQESLRQPNDEDGPLAEFDNLNFFSDDVKWDEIENRLSAIPWTEEFSSLDPTQIHEKVVEICLEVCSQHFPKYTST